MKTILGTGQLGLAIMQLLIDKNPEEKILLVNRTGKLSISIPQKRTSNSRRCNIQNRYGSHCRQV